MSRLWPALVAFLLLTLGTGMGFPLLVFLLARLPWPHQAEGSLIQRHGQVLGSAWVGQAFRDPRYFWGRPSATVDAEGKEFPFNGGASGGSNLAPGNQALAQALASRSAELKAADPEPSASIPVDLVTASGSGLDPHLSPAAALFQVHRVARLRGLDEDRVRRLVLSRIEGPQFGLLGEARVNVLELNLALDGMEEK